MQDRGGFVVAAVDVLRAAGVVCAVDSSSGMNCAPASFSHIFSLDQRHGRAKSDGAGGADAAAA